MDKSTIGQLLIVRLVIDKTRKVPQRALDFKNVDE